MRRAQLEHHLLLGAQVELLHVAPRRRSHTCSLCPYFPPSRSSGFTPSFTMFGVPQVLVTIVSSPRCHQMSYSQLLRSAVDFPAAATSNVSGSITNVPPGPLPSGAPSALR